MSLRPDLCLCVPAAGTFRDGDRLDHVVAVMDCKPPRVRAKAIQCRYGEPPSVGIRSMRIKGLCCEPFARDREEQTACNLLRPT